jgi:hypothetical protein
MESLGGQYEIYKQPDGLYFTPEQLAVQALVDEMIRRADEGTFAILNKELERVRNEQP